MSDLHRGWILVLGLALFGVTLYSGPAAADGPGASRQVTASGLPYLSDDKAEPRDLVDAIRARRGGRLLNLDRMLLHSPNFAKAWNGIGAAVRNQLALPARHRELAIMAIAVLNKADYEWLQHEAEYLAAGASKAQLAALRDFGTAEWNAALFDEAERATLDLTREMTKDIVVRRETMARVRTAFPDQQAVELVGTIATYNMVSRFLVATGIGPEQTGGR